MHIVVESAALRIIRAIRCDASGESSYWLPSVDLPEREVRLPGQQGDDCVPCESHTSIPVQRLRRQKSMRRDVSNGRYPHHPNFPHLMDDTLESAGFQFDAAEVNRRVDLSQFGDVGRFTADSPLVLGIFDERSRHTRKTVRARMLPRSLPSRALIQVDANLSFASPELTVVQMAARVDAIALARVIMELTGTYSLPPQLPWPIQQDGEFRTRYSIAPVTTIERIRAMMCAFTRIRGRKTLEKALDIALEGSASPMETKLALMLSIPMEHGGYGFPVSALNPRLDVPAELRFRFERDAYHPDIFIQSAYADIEYESNSFHFDPLQILALRSGATPHMQKGDAIAEKLAIDRRRMRDLQSLGLQVIPVTARDCATMQQLDNVAWALAVRCEQVMTLSLMGESDPPVQTSLEYMNLLDMPENRAEREILHARLMGDGGSG